MTALNTGPLFVYDDADDRDRASDGVSRYGVYLRRNPRLFAPWDGDAPVTDDPVVFAAAAWQVATSPTMAPPYLSWTAERIQSVTLAHSDHAPALIARVRVAAPRPAPLAGLRGFGDWDRGDRWNRGYHTPDDAALAHAPALLTSAEVLFHLPAADLYVPADAPARLTVTDAKASVKRLARLLHERLVPVLAALDSSEATARGGRRLVRPVCGIPDPDGEDGVCGLPLEYGICPDHGTTLDTDHDGEGDDGWAGVAW
ncbi:hypothetical protein [Actinomadura chibensis]|uniref:Uncharacterized protein n=1 Tax=Actinomadura chibensis TaxID=392828 RepID=A0A5D0NTA7_9ACTN|nr:hypothetical protein [Actinomadura chibensis]TYB47873.1 hypothetical protein FXF69_01055 [Actinomadura chibensis]